MSKEYDKVSQHQPRVSIGLPVYNGERYLKATLDSILAQTYTDFELIISDNCSVDRTQQICEEYASKDQRIKYYRNSHNLGVAPNYNRVFALASGEYFKWADYDDLLAPEFIAKCLDGLMQNPQAAVSYPRAKLIDEHGDFVADCVPQPAAASPQPHVSFRNLILSNEHFWVQASGLMRAQLVKRTVMHGSYPCSDEVFMAHLGLLGYFYEIPDRLFYLRSHPNQSSKGVLASERARVLFFDTSLKDKIVPIKWLYFKNCLTAINQSSLHIFQRLFCYLHLLQWLLQKQNRRSMLKDLLLLIHQRIPLFSHLQRNVLDAANKTHHYQ